MSQQLLQRSRSVTAEEVMGEVPTEATETEIDVVETLEDIDEVLDQVDGKEAEEDEEPKTDEEIVEEGEPEPPVYSADVPLSWEEKNALHAKYEADLERYNAAYEAIHGVAPDSAVEEKIPYHVGPVVRPCVC